MSAPAVIVSGMIAATPAQGGATWAVLQYLRGLRRLGCDVHFVEPMGRGLEPDSSSVRYLEETMRRFGFAHDWTLLPEGGEPIGRSRERLLGIARDADLLLSVSGMLTDEELLGAIDTRAYLDLDPAFNQLWHAVEGVDMRFDAHTHFVSIADQIGSDSPIPDCGRDWLATLPPVVIADWPVAQGEAVRVLTTVGHWRSYGSIHHAGFHYGQKAHSLRPLFALPSLTGERFELALAVHPDELEDLDALRDNDWKLIDPAAVAATPDAYQRFVQSSWAEFGIAKLGYVVSSSGWFSDRSACYLASGRPVLAQDTGFGRRLPVGAGLFAFTDESDVADAIAELDADYDRHRVAAREIALEHLDSDLVLGSLLERLGTRAR